MASRVLAILAAFDGQHRYLTLSEIAGRSGLPLATAHRLVRELAEWRALHRDAAGRYSVGLRMWEVGLLSPLQSRLREAALPYLQDLYESTGENVHLAVRDGYDAMYIERLSGHRSVPVVSRSGGRLPLHATGVGKALLAWETEDFQSDFLRRPLRRLTPYTVTVAARLRAELEEARDRGYATTSEEMTLGTSSIAAPVLVGGGPPVCAVAIVVRSVQVDPTRLSPSIVAAARGIAARLAGLPPSRG